MKKIMAILLLTATCNADYLVLKLGSRGLTNGNLAWDWRDGQISYVFPEGTPFSELMKTHNIILKVAKKYTKEEIEDIQKEEVDENGNLVRRRNFYIPIAEIPQVKNLSAHNKDVLLKRIYNKTESNGIIDLSSYNVDSYIKDARLDPIPLSDYDKGGSVASGTYTIGTGQDWANISTFEQNLATTLIGGATGIINVAYNDTTAVTWAGIVTSTACPIYLTTSAGQRHAGKWDATKSSHTVVNGNCHVITSGIEYITFDGLQSYSKGNGSDVAYRIESNTATYACTIKNCIIRGDGGSGTFNRGIRTAGGGGNRIHNNIIYGFDGVTCYGINGDVNTPNLVSYIYDNVVASCTIGIYDSAANPVMVIKNNITDNCPDGFNTGTTWGTGSDYNISDLAVDLDTTTTQTHSKNLTEVAFVDSSNAVGALRDYHLQAGDTAAKDAGIDLSADQYGFTTDIDGETRSGTWDIGADEIMEGGEPPAAVPVPVPPTIIINWGD